jgi:hypothetical protein
MDLPLFLFPCYRSFGCSLSHQCSYFRWPTQGTMLPPTTLRTRGRTTTTMTPTRHYPLRLLLSKFWLCKPKCFRPWSTCMLLTLKRHHLRRAIGLEIFSAPSHQPFLMMWSQWMLMTSSSLLRRGCKWCNATIVRRCC